MRTARSGWGTTDALLLFTTTVWGINYTAVKVGSRAFTPLTFTWMRVLIAAIVLIGVVSFQRNPLPRPRDIGALLGLGMLGSGIYQLLFVTGVTKVRIADAALLAATSPVLIALISHAGGIERIRPKALLGIALSICGVAVVVFGSTQLSANAQRSSFFGLALVLTAVLCWSIFTAALRPYTLRVDPVQINAFTMIGGAIPILFVTPIALAGPQWTALTLGHWGIMFYSSVVSMGLAYLFWFRGVRVLGPTRTGVYSNLQPAIAIAFAWLALHEVPTPWQGLGAATIIAGIILTRS